MNEELLRRYDDSCLKQFDSIENISPAGIEARSMELISEEMKKLGLCVPKQNEPVVKRVIHTTADFDYAEHLVFSKDAVLKAVELFKTEKPVIVTDTNMAFAGVSKPSCKKLGIDPFCFMADKDVSAAASSSGVTRASCSIDKASRLAESDGIFFSRPIVFAVGNAPTALVRIRQLYDAGILNPSFIIAVPVGFVNVVAAKKLVLDLPVPHIVSIGRKGGSTVAAAILNAILYEAAGVR